MRYPDDYATPAVISMRGAGFVYPGPPPITALEQADVEIRRGDYLSVVGPSGSGKSTLVNLMALLDRPTTGSVWLDGIDVSDLPERQRAPLRGRRIGIVFQAFHLLSHRSATENVMIGQLYSGVARRDRRTRALDALAKVGLARRAEAPPSQLSGGERQRVAIARALVNEPSLLICDEPSGNLDSRNTEIVLQLLDGLHQGGMTLVVITHNPDVAARASRHLQMADGRVWETTALASSDRG